MDSVVEHNCNAYVNLLNKSKNPFESSNKDY